MMMRQRLLYGGIQLGVAIALIPMISPLLLAQSITPSRTGGTAVTRTGNQFEITGGQRSHDNANLFQQFERFGLTQSQIANFIADPGVRNILATVNGGEASVIDGLLRVSGSNANLYLLNPSGILFGPNARLDLPASFFASTANGVQFGDRTLDLFSNPDFAQLVGNPTGFSFSALNPGAVVNTGNLAVTSGQSLSLTGGAVINTGTLTAPGGQITVAAIPGETHVRLSQTGALLSLDVLPDGLTSLATAPTTLPELLTGGVIPDMGLQVDADGTVRLVATNTAIPTATGTAIASGTLNASGTVGGNVDVLGDRVGVVNATLNADGTTGGGTLRIGGDYQGRGTIPNATHTYVNADSSLTANAIASGNGGRIIVWADDSTAYYGTLSATGGSTSGNGGFAEVSGRQNLGYYGSANLSATNGISGSLLLDPENIVIGAIGTDDIELLDGNIFAGDGTPGQTFFISEAALEGATGNIRMEATNHITINLLTPNPFPGSITPGSPEDVCSTTACLYINAPGSSLEFFAGGDFISEGTNFFFTPSVHILIDADTIQVGDINTGSALDSAGRVTLLATQNIEVASIRSIVANFDNTNIIGEGGDIRLEAGGKVTVNGTLSSWSNNGNAGDIDIQAGNGIQINCTSAVFCVESFAGGIANVTPIGNSGDITFSSTHGNILIVSEGNTNRRLPLINSATASRTGNPGDIIIVASNGSILVGEVDSFNTLNLLRTSPIAFDSSAQSLPPGTTIDSGSLLLQAGNRIEVGFITNYAQSGSAGTIELVAPDILVSSIDSRASGNGGDVSFNGNLILQENFQISTGSLSGSSIENAGDITFAGSILGDYSAVVNGGEIRFANEVDIASLSVNAVVTNIDANISTDLGLDFNSRVDFRQNSVLQANEITLEGAVTGNGNTLTLQPSQDNQRISLGTSTDNSTFELTADELSRIDNFSQITIGRTDGTGGIDIFSPITFNDSVILEPGQGAIRLGSGLGSGGTDITLGTTLLTNDVAISSGNGNVRFLGTVDGNHDLTVRAGSGAVSFDGVVGGTTPLQDLIVSTSGILTLADDVTLQGLLVGNALRLRLGGNVRVLGGDVVMRSPISLIDDAIINASNGSLSLLNSVNSPGAANDLTLRAGRGDLRVQNINTNGGNLVLNGSSGSVVSGNLTTSSPAGGGNVTVVANTRITTENIDTSAVNGDAGDVLLDPADDIQVGFINAQSANGSGGNIEAETGSLFRCVNSFVASNGIRASISAIGGTQGGNITIRHFGGQERIPFLVGGSSNNGTVAAIVTGRDTNVNAISPQRIFPGSYDQFGIAGDIRLITQDFTIPNGTEPRPITPLGEPKKPSSLEIEEQIFALEYYFTSLTEQYFNTSGTPIRTLDAIQTSLKSIERQTGVKPAVIYAFFYPESLTRLEDANPLELRGAEQPDDILHLVLVTAKGRPVIQRVPGATRATVPGAVNELRRTLLDGEVRQRDRSYMPFSQQVYGWLIQPLEIALQKRNINNLVFVMEPDLRSAPLAALHDGQDFIIRRYSVGMMPSVSLTDMTYENIRGSSVLAGGASEFEVLEPLPAAENEVVSIVQQLWKDGLLLNEDFTRENLIETYRDRPHGIVHLATHARFSPAGSDGSYIQLYREQLRLDELRTMGWGEEPAVKLLVLSACNTATGSREVELGFGGIAVQAGVESVLASLWRVNDAGTLALMAEFYQQLNLPSVTIKAEALRRAQLALLDGEVRFDGSHLEGTEATVYLPRLLSSQNNLRPTHPYYWSGFTMIGSPW